MDARLKAALTLLLPTALAATAPALSAQDANNPIDPAPTFGLWNRFYGDEFSRLQILGNVTYGEWFFRFTAEEQIDYETATQARSVNFNGANFMVARLLEAGPHQIGLGGIISYFNNQGVAGGVSGVSVSTFGLWKFITLTTLQGGDDIFKLEFQPGIYRNFDDGWYFRSHPRMLWDFETDEAEIPIGAGIGKTFGSERVYNIFFEPQFDVRNDRWMLYTGFKILF